MKTICVYTMECILFFVVLYNFIQIMDLCVQMACETKENTTPQPNAWTQNQQSWSAFNFPTWQTLEMSYLDLMGGA